MKRDATGAFKNRSPKWWRDGRIILRGHTTAQRSAKRSQGLALHVEQPQRPRTEQDLACGVKVGLTEGVRVQQCDASAGCFSSGKQRNLPAAGRADYGSSE